MQYVPYDYQKYAIKFIVDKPISALLIDMGMGKSSVTLSAIDILLKKKKIKKVLVIAPIRVCKSVWGQEIEKWEHLNHLTYSVAVGTEKKRLDALSTDANIYIINRENVEWLVEKSGIKFDYDMVVIDELSSFKNYNSKRFKAFMKIRPKIKRIVGLTGTPTSNGLMDLFAEYKILDGGERLGQYITHYRQKYFEQDDWCEYVWYIKRGASKKIYDKISDITISMKAIDYLKMPPLIINEIKVELDEKDKKVYKTLKNQMLVDFDGKEIDATNAGVLSNKLLQLANGSIYDEDKNIVVVHDKKLDALEDLIEQANGKNVLVAYWFKHDIKRISERFKCREILNNKDISDWNNGNINVGLIHPASAGHGLNLQTGGSILIWFGLTWSLELYEQTNARLWRQGQKENVVIHHIITKDTIDEDVMKALKSKGHTQSALIDAVKAEVNRL